MSIKFNDVCRNNGTKSEPCDLTKLYIQSFENGETNEDFLKKFDFESREEIQRAIQVLALSIVSDPYIACKPNRESATNRIVYSKFNSMLCSVSQGDKYAIGMSGILWNGFYARKKLAERVANLFPNSPNLERFAVAEKRVQEVYGFSVHDLEKLRYFVAQVRDENFHPSHTRMLYLFGDAKKTGKTTTAKAIVAILNGHKDIEEGNKYSTSLAQELQIQSFSVPKISEANVALMDECFYADMTKTYNQFKSRLTSFDGKARLPYGQEFKWYGRPNYVATSNEGVKKFIKDFNDRRFLTVEFRTEPKEFLSFDEIYKLWYDYIANCTPKCKWSEWSQEIESFANEFGEYQQIADDFALDMKKSDFINFICNKVSGGSRTCNANKIGIKTIVDYFARENSSANKQKNEIEKAMNEVFGGYAKKQDGTSYNFWYLDDLKAICEQNRKKLYEDKEPKESELIAEPESDIDDPFSVKKEVAPF